MKKTLSILLACLAGAPVHAEDGIRQEAVHFQKGHESATLKGRLQGDHGIDYRLGAKAGQRRLSDSSVPNAPRRPARRERQLHA
jgi:hypothetical protein